MKAKDAIAEISAVAIGSFFIALVIIAVYLPFTLIPSLEKLTHSYPP